MKTITNLEVTENIFGMALKALLDSTKSRISRKEWTVLLGVSDAAISQWSGGKTFPTPEKIKIILSVYDKFKLVGLERRPLDYFLRVLELPIEDLWSKVPSKMKGLKGSDYVLDDLDIGLRNSMSHLYYNLKLELSNQFNREIMLHKQLLISLLLREQVDESPGIYAKLYNNELLAKALTEEKNTEVLINYTKLLERFHAFSNELLLHAFQENNFPEDNFNIDFTSVLENCKIEMSRKVIEHINPDTSLKHLSQDVKEQLNTKCSRDFYPERLESYFENLDVNVNDEALDIFFRDPVSPNRNLMHMSVIKVPELSVPLLRSDQSIYWTFNFGNSIKNNKIFIGKNAKHRNWTGVSPNYSVEFNFDHIHSGRQRWDRIFSDRLNHILKNNKASASKAHAHYLIDHHLSNNNYLVEILSIEKNSTISIANKLDHGFIFLILGSVLVTPLHNEKGHNEKKHMLSPMMPPDFTKYEDVIEDSCSFAQIDVQMNYKIQSEGCDSIALFVHYQDDVLTNLVPSVLPL